MDLEYETNLEDASEPQIRHHLRSKTFRKQCFTAPARTGLVAVLTLYAITLIRGNSMSWWIYPLAFLLGYAVIYFTLRDTVTKRMRKYIKTEIGHKLPATVKYVIGNGKMRCDYLGAEITFDLGSLSEIREDAKVLELDFGDVGLCTIPVRVFEDTSHKQNFLNTIRREQDGESDS